MRAGAACGGGGGALGAGAWVATRGAGAVGGAAGRGAGA